jgi:site-specific DNA-cytosine methylase
MQDQWVAYQDIAPTLRSEAKQSLMSGDGNINAPLAITYAIQGNIIDREVGGAEGIGIAENAPMYTLTSTDRRGVGVVGLNGNHLCWTPLDEQSHTLSTTRVEQVYIPPSTDENAQDIIWESTHTDSPARICTEQHIAPTLQARMGTGGNSTPFVGVRRLTPTECERLQGFPDGWTDGQADSHRYKQLGNAVAVPVAEWIGRRMKEVHNDGAI